ncbi:unnamed protein product [Meloidogyne enterolobii]|uniref:Uncharacterized protein n=1 Tax=Meloidogyne enterolobii TaxID=390850 RepID=A0ACB0YEU5_MELEN
MKFISILIFLIYNSILWNLINSVKNNKSQKEFNRVDETSKKLNKILNDGAESSVTPQIEKYRETLIPNTKITKLHKTANKEEKGLKKNEYMRDYYQQHKNEKLDYNRNYKQNNKEKILQYSKDYYQKNRDRLVQGIRKYREDNKENTREYQRKYRLKKKKERDDVEKLKRKEYKKNYNKKNKEKRREYNRNYYLKRKNKKENLQNDNYVNKVKPSVECNENVQINNKIGNDNTKGTLFVNPQTCECEANLSDTNACLYEQTNVQSVDGLHTQQMDDHDDLIDLSLSDDSHFLDYLNSFPNSTSGSTSFVDPQNKEWENKGKEQIVSKENLQLEQRVIHEGGSSSNLQMDNCDDNLMNFHNVEENVHDRHHNQQNTDCNDFDMNILEDPNFLDYLNEIRGSKSG